MPSSSSSLLEACLTLDRFSHFVLHSSQPVNVFPLRVQGNGFTATVPFTTLIVTNMAHVCCEYISERCFTASCLHVNEYGRQVCV